MADGISLIRGFRGAISRVMNRGILYKSRIVNEEIFPSTRLLVRPINIIRREASSRSFSAKQLRKEARLFFGVLGAAIGFSVSTMNTEGLATRLKNLHIIPCANAVEAFDDNEIDSAEENKPRKSKRSEQFNFIADAIESATPAVVYIEVSLTNIKGDFCLLLTVIS